MTWRYRDPRQCWREVLLESCRVGAPRRRRTVELAIDGPCEPLRIADAGFHPNRWVSFCDDYLGGGPEFEDFLASGARQFIFHNWGGHKKGGCLTKIDLRRRVLWSRASNWIPTGILDLKLLNVVMRRTGLTGFSWVIDDLNVDPFTASASVDFPREPLDRESDWLRRARAVVSGDAGVKLLGRHQKALRRHDNPLDTDESEIHDRFVHFTPEDVARLAGTSGRRVRNYLRAASGRLRGAGYAWSSSDHPEAAALLAEFGLGRIDVAAVATERARLGRRTRKEKTQ